MKKYNVRVNGVPFEVEVELLEDEEDDLPSGLPPKNISALKAHYQPQSPPPAAPAPVPQAPAVGTPGEVKAPLAGQVTEIMVAEGDRVKHGQVVLSIEAMKMNTKIHAASDGKVSKILTKVGDSVQQGQTLMKID